MKRKLFLLILFIFLIVKIACITPYKGPIPADYPQLNSNVKFKINFTVIHIDGETGIKSKEKITYTTPMGYRADSGEYIYRMGIEGECDEEGELRIHFNDDSIGSYERDDLFIKYKYGIYPYGYATFLEDNFGAFANFEIVGNKDSYIWGNVDAVLSVPMSDPPQIRIENGKFSAKKEEEQEAY